MKTLHLKESDTIPDEDVDRLLGTFLDEKHYDILIDEDADVFMPNGEPLMKFRHNVIPSDLCRRTFPIWEEAAKPTDNRGIAAGAPEIGEDGKIKGVRKEHGIIIPGKPGDTRLKFLKQDGTVANKTVAKTVNSGIVGYIDSRDPRFPYCRMTAYTAENLPKLNQCLPVLQLLDAKFKELIPDRHAAQQTAHDMSNKDFTIPGCSFSTVTCNKTFRTAAHVDKSDYEKGFGVMTCMRKGNYKGGYLIFPKFRVAVNMTTGCICLANVHHLHGNSPMIGIPGTYSRISLVCYFRERIGSCGSAEEERQRAMIKTEAHFTKQGKLL